MLMVISPKSEGSILSITIFFFHAFKSLLCAMSDTRYLQNRNSRRHRSVFIRSGRRQPWKLKAPLKCGKKTRTANP